MDIKKIVDGREQIYCLPASQYIAAQIAKEHHEEYDIDAFIDGTGATLKKYSKRKYVDHYDRENVQYLRSSNPPVNIGAFYWEGDNDLAVFYKTLTESEDKILRETNMISIPHDVIKHLRTEDLVEIIGVDISKTGKEEKIKFKAKKKYIAELGKINKDETNFPIFLVPKSAFVRYPLPVKKRPQKSKQYKRFSRR